MADTLPAGRDCLIPKLISVLMMGLITAGCSALKTQQDTQTCADNLASCVQVQERSQVYVAPLPIDRDDLLARVAELKRWLAWQKATALGQTDQPFESRERLVADAPQARINPALNADARLLAIEELAASGDLEQALKLARELMEVEPDQARTITLYSALLSSSQQYDASIALLERAIAENPEVPEFYNNQAVNFAAKGDLGRSIELLQTAFATHPSFARIQSNLKQLYQATARRALSPLETPIPPELTPIKLHFEPPAESKEQP